MKTTTAKKYQQQLFGQTLDTIIPEMKSQHDLINSFLRTKKLYSEAGEYETYIEELLQIEKRVRKQNVQDLLSKEATRVSENDIYLNDKTIEDILTEIPPEHLLYLGTQCPYLQSLTSREKLSLTRFTEDKHWKSVYQSKITKVTQNDFATLPITITNIQNGTCLDAVLSKNKPWGVSHSKEAGVIIVFETPDTMSVTPTLLRISVFLHYVFEVSEFSNFISSRDKAQIGTKMYDALTIKDTDLPFLTDHNAHDETLYWKRAMNLLSELIPDLIDYIEPYSHCITNENEVKSLNYTDILWDLNNIGSRTHYHLKQELWYELQEHIFIAQHNGIIHFDDFVRKNTLCSNRDFMKQIVN